MTARGCARRDFLRLSAMLGAAAGAHAFGLRRLSATELQAAQAGQDAWIPTTCMMCGGTTGVLAHVVDGRVIKIEPNKYNPAGVANIYEDFISIRDDTSVASGARMCPKGNAAIMSLYDPDRVRTPLKRVGPRGAGQWQQITYNQAIFEIASALGSLRSNNEPEKLVWFTEDNNFIAIQQSFCNAFDTPNFLQHSNLCDVARKVGFETTLGFHRPLADLRNTRYMLIFGWNPLGAMKWAHLPRILLDGLANGAKLVLVDPRCSETGAKVFDYQGRWLPIRPGTDGALALAMANVIIGENLYDASFVNTWSAGFDKFSAFVKDKTPDWAAKITGLTSDTIRQVARELAVTKPAVVDAWSGVSHHTNGAQAHRAVAMLAGLIGQVDAPGTLILPDRAGPKFATGTGSARARVDGKGAKYPFGHGSGIYVEVRDALLTGQPYRPKAGVFVFQNFVHSVPNAARNIAALQQLELSVVVDTHMSETAMLADYVIPGSNFLERWDLYPQWVTFPAISLRQPVVPPLPGAVPEYEFVKDLANALGLYAYPFDVPYTQYLDDALRAGVGIGLDELKNLPGATWVPANYSTRYLKYRTQGFNTKSGKFEFYSQQMADKGVNPLPEYVPAQDGPTSAYPFHIINWKEALHTHSRTMNNRWLMELHGENELWINAKKADSLGISDGDMVWVENLQAKARAKARLTTRIHPNVVGLTHGFGHTASGPVAQNKGTNDTQFIPGRADPISGMAAHKDGAVRVYK